MFLRIIAYTQLRKCVFVAIPPFS